MVGVAGRSKACHTCLKRHIKCDETKPFCNRCIKAGYVCKGYDRKLNVRICSFDKAQPRPKPSGSELIRMTSTDFHIPQELCLIAFKNDIHFSFLFTNFVWSQYGSPWLQNSARGELGALSLEACKAFSIGTFGKHHHLPDLELDGAEHYDRAVRKLSSLLPKAGAPGSEQLIVPIMILLLQSSLSSDSRTAVVHIQGLVKLLQVCGPQRFRSKALRPVYESCRATLITVSLITKSKTFLESETWRIEPWLDCPFNDKTLQNQLVDILSFVPGLLQEQIQVNLSNLGTYRQHLIECIEKQLDGLRSWRYLWQSLHANVMYELDPSAIPTSHRLSTQRPFRNVLAYSSFTRATEISLYNAVLICLLGILWSLEPPDAKQTTLHDSPLLLPHEVTSLRDPAIEICRTFEFQLATVKQNQESTLFWLLPLGLASKILEDDIGMSSWIQDMLDSSRVTRGYGTGANTYGFGNYNFPRI